MLTGVENQERIHFCAQIDVAAGGRISAYELHPSVGVDRDFAEKVYVRDQIHLAQSPFSKLDQELVSSVSVKCVALFLVARRSVFRPDQRSRRVASKRIVPSTGVRRNGAKNVSHIAQEYISPCQFCGVLSLQSVRQIEAIERLIQVVKHRTHICAAFHGVSRRV